MKIQLQALAILSLVAILPATKAANLVQNGGFETGDFTDWTLTGNTGFTGVDTNSAYSGTYGGDFGAVGSDGYLDQNIATTIGDTYDITFWLSNDGGTPSDFSSSFGGTTGVSLTDPNGFSFTEYSYTATATTTSTDLNFTIRQDPAYFHLDDVSVTSGVPDSGPTLLLVAATLAGICALGYRSRKNLQAV